MEWGNLKRDNCYFFSEDTKKMKNVRIFLGILSVFLLISIPTFVVGQPFNDQTNVEDDDVLLTVLSCFFCKIFYLLFYFAGAVATLVVVISGIKWIASGDDANARGAARSSIVHAVIGLIIVLVAVFLVWWIVESVSAISMLDPRPFIDGCSLECNL